MSGQRFQHPSFQQPRPKPDSPRRVQGGVRLPAGPSAGPRAWISRRWMRVVEECAAPEAMARGLEYGRLGQTREIVFGPGAVSAAVQGFAPRAHRVRIEIGVLSHEQWEQALGAMADQAIYSAKVLAGELPVNIEDLFAPMGARLFPLEVGDLQPRCDCGAAPGTWCEHACCAAAVAGYRLEERPFFIFALRGLPADELSERLRQRRAITGAVLGAAPAYTPRPVAGAETPAPPLESTLDEFWTIGPLDAVDTPLERPEVSHPLLRRLGPSPFVAKFPLVGLLATCYDAISDAAIRGGAEGPPEPPAPAAAEEGPSEPD